MARIALTLPILHFLLAMVVRSNYPLVQIECLLDLDIGGILTRLAKMRYRTMDNTIGEDVDNAHVYQIPI